NSANPLFTYLQKLMWLIGSCDTAMKKRKEGLRMTLMAETVPFKELIEENKNLLKAYMIWENYDLNDKVLPVVEDLKEHALFVLQQNYGRYQVSPDIVDELIADVFVYFPPLMQQLAISRLMDAYSVPEEDTETE